MDAWVYLDHGHVFANAQTGNIVLFSILVANGRYSDALHHVPPLAAFCAGLVASRLSGAWLKERGANSRNLRLLFETVGLAVLGIEAPRLSDAAVTTAIGFIAAVQITTLSHIGAWSFNTGMTTGNLRSAFSAATAAWLAPVDVAKRFQAVGLDYCASRSSSARLPAATQQHGKATRPYLAPPPRSRLVPSSCGARPIRFRRSLGLTSLGDQHAGENRPHLTSLSCYVCSGFQLRTKIAKSTA